MANGRQLLFGWTVGGGVSREVLIGVFVLNYV